MYWQYQVLFLESFTSALWWTTGILSICSLFLLLAAANSSFSRFKYNLEKSFFVCFKASPLLHSLYKAVRS